MTHTEFCEIVKRLYGLGWQSKLSRVIVRDIRTIGRWKTGESPVPKVVEEWLWEKTGSPVQSK
jgi:hypothetical protein